MTHVKARVLELARGALAAMEANRRRVDDLNVYPVPDGDTGTNLTLTMRTVVDALEASDAVTREELAREATRTALREMAEEAATGASLPEIVARGDDCVTRTTEMLDVLQAARVVDAGAAGLVEIIRGAAAVLAGEPLPEVPPEHEGLSHEAIHQELSRFRYCTVFVVEGDELDVDELDEELEPLGDSLLVVGDRAAIKVHLHTDDPGRALSLGVERGTIGSVEIANMHAQTEQREERLVRAVPDAPPAASDVVAVAAGA